MAPPTRELPVRVGAGLQLLLPSFWAQATQGPPSSARHDPPSSLPCPLEQLQKLRRTPGSTASPRSQPGPSTCLHATLVSLLPSDGGSLDETQEVLRTAPGAALICSCLSPQQEKVGARAAGRMSPRPASPGTFTPWRGRGTPRAAHLPTPRNSPFSNPASSCACARPAGGGVGTENTGPRPNGSERPVLPRPWLSDPQACQGPHLLRTPTAPHTP